MADDKTNRGPQDAARINIHEDYEVAYWTKKFGVSKNAFKQALGALYKKRRIRFLHPDIELTDKPAVPAVRR